MKKIFNSPLMLINIIVLTLFSQPLFSEWYDGRIGEPCPPFQVEAEWEGPFDTTICVRDFPPKLQGCDTSCCYTVVYYTAIMENLEPPDNYAMNIVGIFWTGDGDCGDCPLYAIIEAFMLMKLQGEAEEEDFLGRDEMDPPYDIPVYEYVKGKCWLDSVECEAEINRCCRRTYECRYDSTGNLEEIIAEVATLADPPCPTVPDTCNVHCGEIPFEQYYPEPPIPDSLFCDLPCTNGEWVEILPAPEIEVSACPGCSLIIHYSERYCDPEDYHDLRIDYIETPGCDGCFEDLFGIALGWVLKYGIEDVIGPGLVNNGDCDTTLRISHAACWGWALWGEFGPYELRACSYDACCWKVYIVCRTSDTTFSYDLFESGVIGTDTCDTILPMDCNFVCDIEPVMPRTVAFEERSWNKARDNIINEKSYVVPNPSTGNMDIHFISSMQGELSIDIISFSGIKLFDFKLKKDSKEAVIPVKMSDKPTGTYLFRIRLDNKVISTGNFTIIK